MEVLYGIWIPFLGTTLGAACVFFLKRSLGDAVQRALTGFAAGVMVAASVWSLLIPAIAQSAALGRWSFLPAALGFWAGILFLLALDHIIPHLHAKSGQAEGPKSRLQRTTMMVLAVTLHNIPEGMAVGVVYAGYLSGQAQITAAGALALSLGIAIQNFPEGAIISLPLRAEGMKKSRAFLDGVLSGVVEPIGAVLTILAAAQRLFPLKPAGPAVGVLQCHEQRVVRQPEGVFLHELAVGGVGLCQQTVCRAAQHLVTFFVQSTVVDGIGGGFPIDVLIFLRQKQAALGKLVEIDKIRVARKRREGLIGAVAVAGGADG